LVRLQDLVDKLQLKVKAYKRQAEEAVSSELSLHHLGRQKQMGGVQMSTDVQKTLQSAGIYLRHNWNRCDESGFPQSTQPHSTQWVAVTDLKH